MYGLVKALLGRSSRYGFGARSGVAKALHRGAFHGPIGFAALVSGLACAQPATDNDYYTTKDAALLRSVERYHVQVAEEKIRTKYYSSARQDVDFVLRYFPNHPQGLLLMVQLCTDRSITQPCDLDLVFENAIAVNPNAAGTYVTQGVYLHRIKRYSKAIASYQRALAIDPSSVNAHYDLGLAYLETKQYDLANEQAQRAYGLSAPLPGLRARLQQLGQWKPVAAMPADTQGGRQAADH
jgi:tetratricopeptide (TPR) repeat protein